MPEEAPKPTTASEHSPEEDARTLGKAHEVRRDAKRMRAVNMHIRGMVKAVAAGRVGRKGIGPGLTKRIAHGTVRKHTSRLVRSKRSGGR